MKSLKSEVWAIAVLAAFMVFSSSGVNAAQIPGGAGSLFGAPVVGGRGGGASAQRIDADTLRGLLSKERNIIIEEQGDTIVLDGRVSSQSAQNRLAKILAKYDNILDLTEFIQDEEAILARADYLKKKIEERLNRGYDSNRAFAPMQTVHYEIVENEVIIVGELNNMEDVSRVAGIIDTYEKPGSAGAAGSSGMPMTGGDGGNQMMGGASSSHITVRKQPLEVDLIFARLSENDQRTMGIGGLITGVVNIPELTYAAPGTTIDPVQGTETTPAGTKSPFKVFRDHTWAAKDGGVQFDSVSLSLNELETSDRILSRPHLSTLNGTSANFHAGGQIGMRLIGSDSSSVEWKDYGTILTATPTLTSDGRIHMKIRLEITTPTASPGGDDVGFSRFEHESETIISANQGMILSGIIRNLRTRGSDGIPWLRKIPILSYFFSSRNRLVESEELIIVAIPRLPEVINSHPVANTAVSERIINGVVQEMEGKSKSWKNPFNCDPETGMPFDGTPPAVRVDILPPEVTENGMVVTAPVARQYGTPSYAPQQVDLMGDLVSF